MGAAATITYDRVTAALSIQRKESATLTIGVPKGPQGADRLRAVALGLDPIVHVEEDAEDGFRASRLSEIVSAHGWEKAEGGFPEVSRILRLLEAAPVAA